MCSLCPLWLTFVSPFLVSFAPFVVRIVFVERRELKMNFTFLVAISLLFLVSSWLDTEVRAQQDDLVAKAQKERALVVTGTALASQGERYLKAFKERYPFLNTTYTRADFLKGVQLYPADWPLSDSFDEHNKLFREIFWQSK